MDKSLTFQAFVKENLKAFYTTNVLCIIGPGSNAFINQIVNNNLNWQEPFYERQGYGINSTPCPTIYTNKNISPLCSDQHISIFDSNLNFICYYTPQTIISLWKQNDYADPVVNELNLHKYFTKNQIMIIHIPKINDKLYFCCYETIFENYLENIKELEQNTMFRIEKCLYLTAFPSNIGYEKINMNLQQYNY